MRNTGAEPSIPANARLALEKLPSMLLKRWVLLLGGLLNGSELIAQPLSLALESSGLPLLALRVPLLPNGPVVFHLVLNQRRVKRLDRSIARVTGQST